MRVYGTSTTLTLQVSRSSPSPQQEKNILPCTAAHWIIDKVNISEWMFQHFWEASGWNSPRTVKERGWSVREAVEDIILYLARLNEEAWIDYLRPRGHSAYLVPNHNTKLIMSELLPRALQFILLLEHYTCINNYKKTIYSILLLKVRFGKKAEILEK